MKNYIETQRTIDSKTGTSTVDTEVFSSFLAASPPEFRTRFIQLLSLDLPDDFDISQFATNTDYQAQFIDPQLYRENETYRARINELVQQHTPKSVDK